MLLTLQHYAHAFKKWPMAMDEKKKNLLYFGCDLSRWYNF